MRPGLRHKKLIPDRQLWTGEEEAACHAGGGLTQPPTAGRSGPVPRRAHPRLSLSALRFLLSTVKAPPGRGLLPPPGAHGNCHTPRLDTGDQTVIGAVRRTAEAEAATVALIRRLHLLLSAGEGARPAALDGGFLAGPQGRRGPGGSPPPASLWGSVPGEGVALCGAGLPAGRAVGSRRRGGRGGARQAVICRYI